MGNDFGIGAPSLWNSLEAAFQRYPRVDLGAAGLPFAQKRCNFGGLKNQNARIS
jgi:hypothetical protein